MRMASEMKNTSNWDYTHCMTVVSLEMSDEPKIIHELRRFLRLFLLYINYLQYQNTLKTVRKNIVDFEHPT